MPHSALASVREGVARMLAPPDFELIDELRSSPSYIENLPFDADRDRTRDDPAQVFMVLSDKECARYNEATRLHAVLRSFALTSDCLEDRAGLTTFPIDYVRFHPVMKGAGDETAANTASVECWRYEGEEWPHAENCTALDCFGQPEGVTRKGEAGGKCNPNEAMDPREAIKWTAQASGGEAATSRSGGVPTELLLELENPSRQATHEFFTDDRYWTRSNEPALTSAPPPTQNKGEDEEEGTPIELEIASSIRRRQVPYEEESQGSESPEEESPSRQRVEIGLVLTRARQTDNGEEETPTPFMCEVTRLHHADERQPLRRGMTDAGGSDKAMDVSAFRRSIARAIILSLASATQTDLQADDASDSDDIFSFLRSTKFAPTFQQVPGLIERVARDAIALRDGTSSRATSVVGNPVPVSAMSARRSIAGELRPVATVGRGAPSPRVLPVVGQELSFGDMTRDLGAGLDGRRSRLSSSFDPDELDLDAESLPADETSGSSSSGTQREDARSIASTTIGPVPWGTYGEEIRVEPELSGYQPPARRPLATRVFSPTFNIPSRGPPSGEEFEGVEYLTGEEIARSDRTLEHPPGLRNPRSPSVDSGRHASSLASVTSDRDRDWDPYPRMREAIRRASTTHQDTARPREARAAAVLASSTRHEQEPGQSSEALERTANLIYGSHLVQAMT